MTDDKKAPAIEPARIIADRPRHKTVKLEWPVEYNGKVYSEVSVVRLTAGDVAKFQAELEDLLKSNPDARVRFPLFRDEENNVIPGEVMDAMDSDDRDILDEVAVNFLPRRYRAVAETDTGQADGENTEPISGE